MNSGHLGTAVFWVGLLTLLLAGQRANTAPADANPERGAPCHRLRACRRPLRSQLQQRPHPAMMPYALAHSAAAGPSSIIRTREN